MNTTQIKFLLALKVCSLAKKESVLTTYCRKNKSLISILYKEGLIQSFMSKDFHKKILIDLRYYYNKVLLDSIVIVSKPSNDKYLQLKDLFKLTSKKKVFIFSTTKGLKNLFDCKTNVLGGKLLFVC